MNTIEILEARIAPANITATVVGHLLRIVGTEADNSITIDGVVSDDTWAGLADQFADGAYATVKGRVRTYVMHQQLLEHLPGPPATVLDVGGGAGHQSFPLAQAGYEVTLLDPSAAMLDKAARLGIGQMLRYR